MTYILVTALSLVGLLWFVTIVEEIRQARDRKRWAIDKPEPYLDSEAARLYLQMGVATVDEVRQLQQLQRIWDSVMSGATSKLLRTDVHYR